MQSVVKPPVKRKRLIIIIVIVLAALAILAAALVITKTTGKASDYVLGQDALKVNGQLVSADLFRDEQNVLFLRYRGDASMQQKTEEELNDMVLEAVLEKVLTDDFFYSSGQKATQKEIDDYYDKYVKPSRDARAAEESDLNDGLDYKTEADTKKDIEVYLLKLKSIPTLAQSYGITLTDEEFDESYKEYTRQYSDTPQFIHPRDEYKNMLLLQKFSQSDKLDPWLDKLKGSAKIEILDPAMNAYTLYKNGEYAKAAQEYKNAYKKYKVSFYRDRQKECESLN
ncbi:hypothetical protein CLHUN_22030 [Ruminiclostridium hungatei]|uniref:Peptidylprolyl isomerase n=1 Tax=Ruminiclostridium hungatei TaxID=48256 RepID=A0A1V4SJC2_RUMHU|nr:SurA N-terminal domain-containing protein [Ruminiclostridium hungatei]OPX43960.1 hypothetical protein CLHUN_22030 [Ruminiclostridium hungatei]